MATKNHDFKNFAKQKNKVMAKRINEKARKRAEYTDQRKKQKLNMMRANLQRMKQLYVQNHPEEENKEDIYPCQICYEPLFEDCKEELHSISSCTDVYHKECLAQYVRTQIEQGKLPILCPNVQCLRPFSGQVDLKALIFPAELVRWTRHEWKRISDRQPGDYLECPTNNCDYYSLRKEDVIVRHDCPRCEVSYCFNCEAVYHKDMTCEDY